jgi:hypothetical protein
MLFVSSTSASTASRSASVTIAIRPFEERDGGIYKSDLGEQRTGLFSAKHWTAGIEQAT